MYREQNDLQHLCDKRDYFIIVVHVFYVHKEKVRIIIIIFNTIFWSETELLQVILFTLPVMANDPKQVIILMSFIQGKIPLMNPELKKFLSTSEGKKFNVLVAHNNCSNTIECLYSTVAGCNTCTSNHFVLTFFITT